jgi:integrase
MRRDGTGVSQTRHVKTALVDFWRYLPREQRERPGSISREQILEFLRPYESLSAKSYNERRGYLCTVFAVAVEFGWLTRSPVDSVPRRRSPRHRPPPSVLQPLAALRLLRWVQSNAPEWVPYFAFCIFAGLRPCVREGEAHRLDEDMRNPVALGGLPALDQDGFWVRGKTGAMRHVSWSLCGPLRHWISAYPSAGLIPDGLSYSQAERRLQAIRKRFGLTHDVMRHTGASAMLYVPGASFAAVAMALDNSERVLRKKYVGVWSAERSAALYGITPDSAPVELALVETSAGITQEPLSREQLP